MKNIIKLLQNIGFTQYESQVYLALLQQANVSGYELAKISGVPASKVYPIIDRLISKEVILGIDSDPVKYVPLPPDEIVSRLRGEYVQTFEDLKEELNRIYTTQELTDNYIWHVSERAPIIRKIVEFIDQSTKTLYLSVWDEEVDEISDALREAAARNVKIILVHFGEKTLGIGTEYTHGREHQIRIERGGRRIALIVDDKRVILGHFQENGDSNAAWTADRGLILLAKDYIIHDIYSIRMVQKFGTEALDIFAKV